MRHFDLEDEFQGFMHKVYPTLPEYSRQYQDVRRIFFAGIGCLYLYMTFELAGGDVPEEVSIKELESIKKQLDDFFHNRLGFNQ